jgi:hypothetical protein
LTSPFVCLLCIIIMTHIPECTPSCFAPLMTTLCNLKQSFPNSVIFQYLQFLSTFVFNFALDFCVADFFSYILIPFSLTMHL